MSKHNSTLTAERLRELLHYDVDAGIFTRLIRSTNSVQIGDVAGSINSNGYHKIRVDGVEEFSHHLAWLYVYNVWPKDQIDHIDGNRANNRLVNLREATQSQNLQNQRKAQSDNKSGLLGAYWNKKAKTWFSQIKVNGKSISLGCYDSKEDAHRAYLASKVELHKFGTLGKPEYVPQKRIKRTNKYQGVYFHKASGLWIARTLKRTGRNICLGYFKTDIAANEAVIAANGR